MQVKDVFDQWAKDGQAERMERGHGETAAPLLHSLPVGPDSTFLDLGCGNAWASRWAAGQGAVTLAVDLSSAMVAKARAAGIEAVVADVAALPVEDDFASHLWSMEALYYCENPDAALREWSRVARPGAQLNVLIDYYAENLASHGWPELVGLPLQLRSETQWRKAFAAAGWTNIRINRLKTNDSELWKAQQGTLHIVATKPTSNERS